MHDDHAERVLAGSAIASAEGARLAVARLGPADFYDPRHWSVVVAADSLPVGLRDGADEWNEACRLGDFSLVCHGCAARVAALVPAYERAWLVGLVEHRPVYADRSGFYARRVRTASEHRREVRAHLDALVRLGVDVGLLVDVAGDSCPGNQ